MAWLLSNRDGGLTDEQGHYRFQTNVWSGNVIGDGLQVTQNSPLGMSVIIGPGDARVPYGGYAYTAWNDDNVTATISTANPSNPRIDRLVLYIDRAEAPQQVNPNNPGIPKHMVVAGTPAAVPTRPSNAAVNSAVGATNPWIDLADIRVNAGVTQITNANITSRKIPVSAPHHYSMGYVQDLEQTTSVNFTDLGVVGPSATVYVGQTGAIEVTMSALAFTTNSGYSSDMGFELSGANSLSPQTAYMARSNSISGRSNGLVGTFIVDGLSQGWTTATAKYKTISGSAGSTFAFRHILVKAL